MVRTTVDIPDAVYRRLKARAATEGSSAKALILRGVARVLKEEPRRFQRPVTCPIVPSKHPGSMRLDNARIYEVISFP